VIPLDEDHAAVLDQVARAVADSDADALAIAGDIFVRAVPPETASVSLTPSCHALRQRTSGRFGSLDEGPIMQGFFWNFVPDRLQGHQILSRV